MAVFAEVTGGRIPGALAVEEKDVAGPIWLIDVDDRRTAATGFNPTNRDGDDPVHAACNQAGDHRLGQLRRVAGVGDEHERSLLRGDILDAT